MHVLSQHAKGSIKRVCLSTVMLLRHQQSQWDQDEKYVLWKSLG